VRGDFDPKHLQGITIHTSKVGDFVRHVHQNGREYKSLEAFSKMGFRVPKVKRAGRVVKGVL